MSYYYIIENGAEFERTESGKSWRSKPCNEWVYVISRQHYENATSEETRRFFNRLGSCRVERNYTCMSYCVTRWTMTNPSGDVRKVYDYKPRSISSGAMGEREQWIMRNLGRIEIVEEEGKGRYLLRFYAVPDIDGHAHTFTYSETRQQVVG